MDQVRALQLWYRLIQRTMATESHTRVAAAILAGGQARRMAGANKAALRVGSARIIDRQLELLRQVADPVFVVSALSDAFTDLGIQVVPDVFPGLGPLGGIYTAIAASPCERTLVVACDMPFLTLALLQQLTRDSAADLVIPRSRRGFEPLCATWSAGCAGAIRRRIECGELKAALLVEELRVEEIGPEVLASCDPHGLLFVNVNTPHDYERAQGLSRLKSKPSQDRIMEVSEPGPKPA
jgi:molybdopterin-guanine dinucleotide biosynthesis protein A